MGFFDKLFGNKAEEEETAKFFGQSKTVLAPIRGKVLAQADIPDETFAQGILGPGCGIEPTGKTVYAPFDGTVNQVASTLHAVGLTSEDGIEILVHVGMDTVEMNGKGFKALVKEGDKVKAGTPLLKVDLDAIRAAGHPTATAIIVTNGDDLGELKMLAEGDVPPATALASVITKITAVPMPPAVLILRDTPKKGHSPMNWLNTILLTMEELISNRSISFTLSIYLSSLSKSMVSRSSSAV